MAVLEYSIVGNNKSLAAAIQDSITKISTLQTAINNLNKSTANLGGLGEAFNKAAIGANNFATAAKKGTQAFNDQQIIAALNRMNDKLAVTTGNFNLFGGSIKNSQQTINAYQGAINSLLANGIDPTDKRIVGFKGHIDQLTQSIEFQKKAISAGTGNSFVGKIGDGIGGAIGSLQGLATGYLGLFAVVAGVRQVVKSNAEIGDSLVLVRQKAGETKEEANSLLESLKKLDTRTSLKGLTDIAGIGAKRGIDKSELLDFTANLDKVNLALNGAIAGGAEGVAAALAKINSLFGITANLGVPEALKRTGAALVELGQHGITTSENLTDFATRTAAVSKVFKLTLPEVLGFGSAFQEAGFDAERAGTSFNKLLIALATKKDKFFAIAQLGDASLTINEFTNLINTNASSALQKFFAGLTSGGAQATDIATRLADLGLKAGNVTGAIIGVATNQSKLNEELARSKTAFDNSNAVLDQSAIKNDTLGSSIDKLGKAFVGATTSGAIGGFFKSIVDGLTNTLNGFSALTNSASWGEFFNRLSHPFGADAKKSIDLQYNIPQSIKESKAIATDFTKNNNPTGSSNATIVDLLSDKSAVELLGMVKKYKVATDQAVTALNDYRKGVYKGLITDGGEFSIADATKNFNNLQNILNIVSAAYVNVRDKAEISKIGIVKNAAEIADAELKTVKAINERILELKNDTLANPSNAQSDIQRIDALRARLAQFGSGSNKANGNNFLSISQSLDDILTKSNSLSDEAGLKKYALDVQKITDKYKDLNQQIDQILAKAKLDLKNNSITTGQFNTIKGKVSIDRTALTSSEQKELSEAAISEAQRVSNEIQRINDEFGVKAQLSRQKELTAIQAQYDAEVVKAQNNQAILTALDAGRLNAIQTVNDKYSLIEQDLQDKIAAIDSQARADISGKQESDTQKIQNEWDKRKQAANKYYDELRRLAASAPGLTGNINIDNIVKGFNIGTLNNKQAATNAGINNASDADINRKLLEPFTRGIDQGLKKFTTDFYSAITNVDTYAKGTFTSIFADLAQKLTTSLNQVFLNTITTGLSQSLSKAISSGTSGLFSNGKITTTGALAGAAALGGSILSAATPATSTVGQGLGGALSGAGTGAAIGSIIPGVGTAIGAVVGGVVGLIGGIFGSSSARKKEEEQRQAQLEEAKKQTQLQKAQLDAYTSTIIGRMTDQGNITNLSVGATGQLIATVSGKDIQFVLDRTAKTR